MGAGGEDVVEACPDAARGFVLAMSGVNYERERHAWGATDRAFFDTKGRYQTGARGRVVDTDEWGEFDVLLLSRRIILAVGEWCEG